MKILKNLFAKDEELSIQDKEKINEIIDKKNNPSTYNAEQIDLTDFVSHLKLEQLNELRELIDKREDELHELYGLKTIKAAENRKYKGELEIKEPVHENDLNNKTYDDEVCYKEEIKNINDSVAKEIEDIHQPKDDIYEIEPEIEKKSIQTENNTEHTQNKINEKEEYIEFDDNTTLEELDTKQNMKQELQNTKNDFYLKIIRIFGEENVFSETKTNFNPQLPKDKEILCIGIRKSDGFNKDSDSAQNTWFIQNIKKLDELAHFKMLTSSPNQKELFWDKEIKPILISYKSTNIIKTKDEFEF
jgi:hypothetical protein